MRAALIFLVLIGVGQSWCDSDDFKAFKIQYNKSYKDNEEEERLKIYHNNRQMINSHNKRYAAGEETFEMGVNEFTDLRPDEFDNDLITNNKFIFLIIHKEILDNRISTHQKYFRFYFI